MAGLTYSELRRRAELIQVTSYRVELDLASMEDAAVSHTQVVFDCRQPGASTFADLLARRLSKITLNGADLPDTVYADGRVQLRDLAPTNVLTVEAEIDFSADGRGLCRFIDRDDGSCYVYTKGMPFTASRIMCCFDATGRAPFDIAVVAPPGWSCISHTAVVESPPNGEPGVWRFETTSPMPPEQLVIAAGPWATARGGADVDAAVVPTLHGRRLCADALSASPAAVIASECAGFQEQALGVAYPFDRLSVLFIPEYSALGGSSPGVTALKESMLHETLDAEARPHVLWVFAHEIAHAWFGSMVLDRGWEASWLTEGVATYLCHLTMEHLAPELHPWARFHVLEEAGAHESDEDPAIHPVAWVPPDDAVLAKPGQTYTAVGPIVYSKPAALLRQLAAIVGAEAVLAGLAGYLNRHAFSEATTDDLLDCLSEACGLDLGSWATEWLRTPGVNTLELALAASPDDIVRSCEIIQHPAPAHPALRSHQTSLEVYDLKGSELCLRDRVELMVIGGATPVPELVGAPAPDVAVLNAPACTYAKVRLNERSRQVLADHLRDLPPDTRAACWVAGWEMVRDGLMPSEEFASWVERNGDIEPDPAVRALLVTKAST